MKLPSDKPFQGVIAQELAEIIPEAVSKMTDGYLTVSTDPIFWTAINAIKELDAKNQQLSVENVQLKAAVEQLKATLTQQNKTMMERLERLEAALTPKPTEAKPSVISSERKK